ncbi:unnamed protein product [Gordionus sp. m RMFG-2023]|uniref:uncharacterized protein LOC135923823 n=1 Tax=Gordionus sp. m RMFG-2023 TaxID=3053472 RepID=UPI0030DF5A47
MDLSLIQSLTDDELRDHLLENGIQAGPIVASTRTFYENKLIKILNQNGGQIYPDLDNHLDTDDQIEDSTSGYKLDESVLNKGNDELYNQGSNASNWSSDDMRRRPIRDFDNFEYESPYLKKRFEIKPNDDTDYLYTKYDIKTSKVQDLQSGGDQRFMIGRPPQRDTIKSSSNKKYIFAIVIITLLFIIFLTFPSSVNWHDEDNPIPSMDT